MIKYLTEHRGVRFCVIGGSAFLIDVGCASFLVRVMPKVPALALAYLASCIFHFLCSKHWTFSDRSNVSVRQIWAYTVTNLTTLAVNTALSTWLLHQTDGNILLAKAIALPPTSVLGYAMLRGFVFRPVELPVPGRSLPLSDDK